MKRLLLLLFFLTGALPISAQDDGFVQFQEVQRIGKGVFYDGKWSPDGELFALSTSQGIRLFDATLEPVSFWETEFMPVVSDSEIEWSPDGQYIAVSGSWERTRILVWDVAAGEIIAQHEARFLIPKIIWHPGSNSLAYFVAGYEAGPSQVQFWDFQNSDESILIAEHVNDFEWDGERFFMQTYDEEIFVQESDGNRFLLSPENWRKLQLNTDRSELLLVRPDKTVILDTETGETIFSVPKAISPTIWVEDAFYLYDWRESLLQIRDTSNGQLIDTVNASLSERIDIHPDGKAIVGVGIYRVSSLDLDTGETFSFFSSDSHSLYWQVTSDVPRHVIEWVNSDELAIIQQTGVGIWDVRPSEFIEMFEGENDNLYWLTVLDELIAAQENRFNTDDPQSFVWDLTTRERLYTFDTDQSWIEFSPDGTRLAGSLAEDPPETIDIWDIETGELVSQFKHWGLVYTGTFSPNGNFLATSGGWTNDVTMIWNLESQELADTYYSPAVAGWSFDGKYFATQSSGTVDIRDSETGSTIMSIEGSYLTSGWNPQSNILAVIEGYNIQLWDIDSQQHLQTIDAHQGSIISVDWSPDGQSLASASDDSTVRIWRQLP